MLLSMLLESSKIGKTDRTWNGHSLVGSLEIDLSQLERLMIDLSRTPIWQGAALPATSTPRISAVLHCLARNMAFSSHCLLAS